MLQAGVLDLLFVEFSVNDGDNREESLRGMEGIVRQCRRRTPDTDICFVYAGAIKNLSRIRPFNIAVHEEVAELYGIPSIDFAAGIYNMLHIGEVEWASLAPDGYHPNDRGHAIYAGFLRKFLDEMLLKEHARLDDHDSLPVEPLIKGNYEHGAMLHHETACYSEDFCIQELQPEKALMNWRYSTEHRYSDHPQAALDFAAEGQCAGLLLLCGPDTGIFEYSVNGEPFVQVNPFDEWCLHAYRPVPVIFPIQNKRGPIFITVRNTAYKDHRSRGMELRVLKLLMS
nr:SGNH/GDSL hydrolase family protein [Paenibacillus sp. JCM 10914]